MYSWQNTALLTKVSVTEMDPLLLRNANSGKCTMSASIYIITWLSTLNINPLAEEYGDILNLDWREGDDPYNECAWSEVFASIEGFDSCVEND